MMPANEVMTFEATVENGQIRLPEAVRLPEHARVYVVVPSAREQPRFHAGSPRLAQPERAADFAKEVIAELRDADLR
jgi:hypothetical protein